LLRAVRLAKQALLGKEIYGLQWGDPEVMQSLSFLKDRYVLPYVNPAHDALEIGPGGGRWTRYLLGFRKLYVVDYYPDLLQQLRRTVKAPNITIINNNGCDFPGVPKRSIDYLFSFDTFVHLEVDLIRAYLENMRDIVKPAGNVVIHYSDKGKIMAQMNKNFSDNDTAKMRGIISDCGFKLREEDLTTLAHSGVARFTLE